jgi:hypothetical protein
MPLSEAGNHNMPPVNEDAMTIKRSDGCVVVEYRCHDAQICRMQSPHPLTFIIGVRPIVLV